MVCIFYGFKMQKINQIIEKLKEYLIKPNLQIL
jgi:hypothetical protein